MLQYGHKPDSKTIHSKSQLEHFGGKVFNSTQSNSGSQMVLTHEGYVILLHVHDGLFYMDMLLATHDDLKTYPHVFLTVDLPWNPTIVDDEFFFDASSTLANDPLSQHVMQHMILMSTHMGRFTLSPCCHTLYPLTKLSWTSSLSCHKL